MSYIDVLNSAAARADAASTKAEGASQLLEDIANGPTDLYVTTLNGQVPTAATAINDIRNEIQSGAFSDAVEEVVLSAGQTNVTFNNIQTLGLTVYIEGSEGAFRYFDFTATGTDSIVLGSGFSAGTVLYGVSPTNLDSRLTDAVYSSEQSAQNADSSRQDALQFRNEAEAARDAATISGEVYEDTTAGIAATVAGEYFKTVASSSEGFLTLWKNSAGSAVEIDTYPSLQGISEKVLEVNQKATKLSRSLQRLGDNGQTIHADFAYDAYGLGSRMSLGVDEAMSGEDLFTVERATPKWVFGPNGKLREVPPNTLARQWNPATGVSEGVLVEESRTNLLLWSEDFTQGKSLVRAGLDVISTSTPIEGLSEAAYVYGNSTVNYNAVRDNSHIDDPEIYSHYAFVKDAGAGFAFIQHRFAGYSAVFDLSTAEIVSQSNSLSNVYIEPMSGGWFKIGASFLNDPEQDGRYTYVGPSIVGSMDGYDDPERGILVAAFQKEKNPTPSSYIPTTDSPVTRAADNVYRELGDEFNKQEGTIVVRISDIEKAKGQTLFNLMEAGSVAFGPRIQVSVRQDGTIVVACVDDGGSVSTRTRTPLTDNPTIAIAHKAGHPIVFACDGTVSVEFENTSPANLGLLTYSNAAGDRSNQMNTSVFSTEYHPLALSETELINLTS